MTDQIRIRGLTVKTRIGVTEEERATLQPVVIDVDLATETGTAGASDDLADTVDYSQIVGAISELVTMSEMKLLERLAEEIAGMLVKNKGVIGVAVEVKKADPPIDADIETVGVRIERP